MLLLYSHCTDDCNDEDSYLSVEEFPQHLLLNDSNDSSDYKISKFLESLPITCSLAIVLEMKTRWQSSNQLWVLAREIRIAASNHHEVFTKINTTIYKKTSLNKKKRLWFILVKREQLEQHWCHKVGERSWDAVKLFYIQE